MNGVFAGTSSVRALALVTLCLGSTIACAAEPPIERPSTVHLRFGWHPGMVAQVETTRQRVRVLDGQEKTLQVTGHYRMHVAAHEGELLITYSDFDVSVDPSFAHASGMDTYLQRLSAVEPSYVVDSTGNLVRVKGIAQLRTQVQSLMAPGGDSLETAPVEVQAMLETALSEPALTDRARQEWDLVVGMWAGSDLEPGALYQMESEEPIPLLAGTSVPMEFQFQVSEPRSCTEAMDSPSCVELEMVSTPDPEAVRRVVGDLLGKIARAGQPQVERLVLENRVTLLAEPATLLPYRLRVEKRVTGSMRTGDGASQPMSSVDERVSVYTYLPAETAKPASAAKPSSRKSR